jgi:hypothetical protein
MANDELNNTMVLKQKAHSYVAQMKRPTMGCGVLVE